MPLSEQDRKSAETTVAVLYTLIESGDFGDAQIALNNFIRNTLLKNINEGQDPKEVVRELIFQLDEQKKNFPAVNTLGPIQLQAAKTLGTGTIPAQILDCFAAITPNVMASASAMFTGAKMAPEERIEKLLGVLLRGTPEEVQKDTKPRSKSSIFGRRS